LSEQITVVLPSVSTAGILRMIARRVAMRATPIASMMVTAAGSPSGIAETASATDALNISSADSPRRMPIRKLTAASTRITASRNELNRAIRRVSGVLMSSAAAISPEIRPTSVESPTATTTPAPCPKVTSVEA